MLLYFFTDIDECASNNGRCDQVCTNIIGRFECACDPGYLLHMDETVCEGINFKSLFFYYLYT